MIDRYLLRYFLAVLDHGTFSRAAEHCRVSQPTLSVGIAKLETLLGRPLFQRSNRRVELTPAGARFAEHARRIEAEFAEAERVVRDDPPARLVRLGIVPTLPSPWIEEALAAGLAAGSAERFEVVEERAPDLALKLERGRIDMILGPLPSDGAGQPLFKEDYAVALPSDHRLAHSEAVTAQDLAGETMLVRRNCEALRAVSRFFTARGVRPFMAARTVNEDRALAYVRAGLGITVMPRCFAEPGVAMLTLSGLDLSRTIGWRTAPGGESRLNASPAFVRFIETFTSLATQTVRPTLAPPAPALSA
jgi:DNA-binding transcriptional LysR family regulator